MTKIDTAAQEKTPFYSLDSFSFAKPVAYITHNAPVPLSDIAGGSLSEYMQLPLEL